MSSGESDVTVSLSLYVREELPPPASERAVTVAERGRQLADAGTVDEFSRERWPKRVPLGDCDRDLRDVYLAFTGWAGDADVGLQPFFQTRVCYGPETGERTDWLVLPAFALAVVADGEVGVADGEVVAVYPHARDGETATVEDGLDALEAVGGHEPLAAGDRTLLVG